VAYSLGSEAWGRTVGALILAPATSSMIDAHERGLCAEACWRQYQFAWHTYNMAASLNGQQQDAHGSLVFLVPCFLADTQLACQDWPAVADPLLPGCCYSSTAAA
jgi:hypothetical protein